MCSFSFSNEIYSRVFPCCRAIFSVDIRIVHCFIFCLQREQQFQAGMASSSEGSLLRVGFYEVEATIGRGNYALVKLARHKIVKNEVCGDTFNNCFFISLIMAFYVFHRCPLIRLTCIIYEHQLKLFCCHIVEFYKLIST